MVSKIPMIQSLKVTLLNKASTYTILRSPNFSSFPSGITKWNICHLTTIAGRKILIFQEGEATILLFGNFPIICREAMYALDAPGV